MDRLVFATGPVHLDEEGEDLRRDVARLMSEKLGRKVEFTVEPSYAMLLARIVGREVDLAWTPPALYVKAGRSVHATLRAERFAGGLYQGAIFVREGSRITSPEQLRGRRVAWVDQQSCAGYLFPRAALREAGLDPDDCFASEMFAQSHARVVQLVMDGTVDAGATYVQLNDPRDSSKGMHITGWTAFVDARAMRALAVSASIPADTICVTQRVDEEEARRLTEELAQFHTLPRAARMLRTMFGCDRFAVATALEYAPVRRAMLDEGMLIS
jgi:phosphonate transport system substrate-binding protein